MMHKVVLDPATRSALQAFRSACEAECFELLAWWQSNMIDHKGSGFHGQIDGMGKLIPEAPKAAILNTRMLWSFATAASFFPNWGYEETAHRAYQYLKTHFIDPTYGGVYWQVTQEGEPLVTRKQVYAQAFAMYAFSAYHLLTLDDESRQLAQSLFRLLEQHSLDPLYNGYLEAHAQDWGEIEDLRLSEQEPNVAKTMNTHLHVLEAYTNLYRVSPHDAEGKALENLIRIMIDRFVHPETGHLHLFFDRDWTLKSHEISFGHDIEASWLMIEAAEVLGNVELEQEVRKLGLNMANSTFKGLDPQGGLWYEQAPDGHIDQTKDWWPQVEAMVGWMQAFELTGEARYLDAVFLCWEYCLDHLKDPHHGEWFWGIRPDGSPNLEKDKAGPWKAPYHSIRALIECMRRTDALLQT